MALALAAGTPGTGPTVWYPILAGMSGEEFDQLTWYDDRGRPSCHRSAGAWWSLAESLRYLRELRAAGVEPDLRYIRRTSGARNYDPDTSSSEYLRPA